MRALRIAAGIAAVLAATALTTSGAAAQAYPSKSIRMIVPYTPGSPVDVLARVVTQHLGARLGQTIVIDNRPGAGTTIGTKVAANAEPDGYTILIGATSFIISPRSIPISITIQSRASHRSRCSRTVRKSWSLRHRSRRRRWPSS